MAKNESAIVVKNVYKQFRLPHEQQSTIKEKFINGVRRKNKKYTTQKAIKGVSFDIKKGEFFGIVGRNGSGKSTLLKILAGIYQPTRGSVSVHGRLVPFIELGVGFNPELTGRENVYLNGALLNFSVQEIDSFYDEVVRFAELEDFMDQKLKNYSSGMQVRLAFSMAIQAKADILLVDEVLAVGDADFQQKCFGYFRKLKKQKTTVVFVSHDMSSVREYCDRALLVEEGRVAKTGTPNNIADEYTKLFIESRVGKSDGNQGESAHLGTGQAKIKNIKSQKTITKKSQNLEIEFEVLAKVRLEDIVVGFRCKDSADAAIMGTNTKLEQINSISLDGGEKVRINFSIPNVLNNGEYVVDLMVVSSDGIVYDWIINAVKLSVKTEKKTGYLLEPTYRVKVT